MIERGQIRETIIGSEVWRVYVVGEVQDPEWVKYAKKHKVIMWRCVVVEGTRGSQGKLLTADSYIVEKWVLVGSV